MWPGCNPRLGRVVIVVRLLVRQRRRLHTKKCILLCIPYNTTTTTGWLAGWLFSVRASIMYMHMEVWGDLHYIPAMCVRINVAHHTHGFAILCYRATAVGARTSSTSSGGGGSPPHTGRARVCDDDDDEVSLFSAPRRPPMQRRGASFPFSSLGDFGATVLYPAVVPRPPTGPARVAPHTMLAGRMESECSIDQCRFRWLHALLGRDGIINQLRKCKFLLNKI